MSESDKIIEIFSCKADEIFIIFSFKSVSGLNAKTDEISSESLLASIILKLLSKRSLNNLNFSITLIELPIISMLSTQFF